MRKKNDDIIGDYVSFVIKDWKNPVNGFIISYNDEWTLILNHTRDYILDGCIIVRNKFMVKCILGEKELFSEKVLRLKGLPDIKSLNIPIDDLSAMLTYITNKFRVFGLYRKSEDTYYIGKLKSLNSKQLIINFLDTKGKWSGIMRFRPGDIRTIEFNTDYINSLLLITKRK